MSKFLNDNNDAKAIAIPQVFSEKSRAKDKCDPKIQICAWEPILKTLWEKEKILVASIFSFSHNVFKMVISLTS